MISPCRCNLSWGYQVQDVFLYTYDSYECFWRVFLWNNCFDSMIQCRTTTATTTLHAQLILRLNAPVQAGLFAPLKKQYTCNSSLYRSLPGPLRPHARATPAQLISPRCPRRHNGRRVPTPRAGGMKNFSWGRLAISPERWRIVRKCKSHPAPAVLLCCRCALVGAHCSTAVVLLW